MKIRKDFVTNSSSSSQLIAFKNPEIDNEILEKYPHLAMFPQLIEAALTSAGGYGDTTEGELYSTKEEWDAVLMDIYGWDGSTIEQIVAAECNKDVYDKEVWYLENGYKLLQKNVDYCDDFFGGMVRKLAEIAPECVVILECD